MSNRDVLKMIAQKAKRRLIGKENVSNMKIRVINNIDNEFENKVASLLENEDVVINPIHYLIDERVYKKMDSNEQERYLLSTLDKYNTLKNKIENGANYSSFCM